MHTAGPLYRSTYQQLTPLGESASQQAYWLLEGIVGISLMDVVLDKKIALSAQQEQLLQQAIARLLRHEPLQYVLGVANFRGHDFVVSPAVLIPRPETEELVQRILERHQQQHPLRILDVCTGSGCIALSLAKELPGASVWATDISPEALAIAEQNRQRLGVEVQLLQADALQAPFPAEELDVVVSNPPYVRQSEADKMQPNVLDWEPHLALFVPDEDALRFYRAIAREAAKKLKKGGWLYVEINEAYGHEVAGLLQQLGFGQVQVLPDLQGKARMVEGILG
ncbi:peptide chain release factor N(5)-glutamine methyltransferase [Cesiribacter andamanensis]|uniref:Release factor glutamine methyltransferase n=1 Tax=Cesiribacter andamanensis AMV16 TaxID=1279009 RepID=M7N1H1_9BACT|nr:peptide chain release factor N(5)-glutamine methyltransferase [Cesiribacter andamanensis]EMR01066.1 50S ribosomal protein L3 glutamine methyltransferase [Cesiribacter andamanensis AMV16]